MTRFSVFAVLAFALTPALLPASARACEPGDGCYVPVRTFAEDNVVPGNLIYFLINGDEPGPLVLRKKSGEVIPASIRTIGLDSVFAPDETVAADTDLELVYQISHCRYLSPAEQPKEMVYSFRTEAAQPVELQKTTLTLAASSGLQCDDPYNELDRARAQFVGPDALGSVSHLIELTAFIDGDQASMSRTEEGEVVDVETRCDYPNGARDECDDTWTFPSGAHTVEVRSRVIGQNQPTEVVTLSVTTLPCAEICPIQPVDLPNSPDEQALRGDAGAAATNQGDDAFDTTTFRATGKPGSGSGCSVGRSSMGRGLWLLAALIALLAGRRERRRLSGAGR